MDEIEVKINLELQTAILTSPKTEASYRVYKKRDQTAFFVVEISNGALPKALTGHFSTLNVAIEFVKTYLSNHKETHAAKSERLAKYREERNASKTGPKGSK